MIEAIVLFIYYHFWPLLIAYLSINFFVAVGEQAHSRTKNDYYKDDRFWLVFWSWPFYLIFNSVTLVEKLGTFTAGQIAQSARQRRIK